MSTVEGPIYVLHIDDEPDFAEMTAEFLERVDDNVSVETALGPEEGLERINANAFDCIVADYDMPGMNGIELLEAVRNDHPNLPFILYTGKGSEEVASDAISAGVTDYLQKETGPEQYEILANRIRHAVAGHRARRATEESERQLRQVYDRITDGFFAVNSDWEYTYVNEEGAELTGKTADELVGSIVWEAFPELVDSPFEDALRTAMETQDTVTIEEYYPSHDAWYDVRVYGSEGGISIYFRDTTDQKEREQELERHEAYLQQTSDIVTVVDAEGNVQFQSKSTEEITGFSPADVIGQSGFEHVHQEDVEKVMNLFTSLVSGSESRAAAELRVETVDGDWQWVEARGVDRLDDPLIEGIIVSSRDITQRKEHELELERTQRRYTALFEHTNDAIAWVEFDGETPVIQAANPVFENLFAPNDGNVEERDIDRLVAAEDRIKEARSISRQARNGEQLSGELTRDAVDGQRDFLWQAVPVKDPGTGEFDAGFAVYTDITEQKKRERALEALIERVGDLIEPSSEAEIGQVAVSIAAEVLDAPLAGLHLLSEDGQRLEAVAAIDEVREEFGVPPTYDRSSQQTVDALVWEAFDRGEQLYIEDTEAYGTLAEETPAKSGLIQPLDDRGVFIISANEPDAFDGNQRNQLELLSRTLTVALKRVEREATLAAREETLERYQTIIEATGDPVYTLDEDGTITYVNGAFLEFSGYDEDVLLGSHATNVMSDEHYERGTELIRSLLTTESDRGTFEMEFVTADGDRIPCEIHVALLPFEDEFRGTVGVIRDISDRIEHEERLQRERDRFEQFASVVSHDLRNPLSVASGRLELAQEEHPSEHLDTVSTALERMETLIDDLLWLARAGETVRERQPVLLQDLVEGCWQTVDTKNSELVVESELVVRADESRLQQLLENLFRNAVEHGGDSVTIEVGELQGGFYIEDDGPGIPEDERDSVFQAGYSTTEEGSGLGLNIVREIAEAHGWDIQVTAGEAGGARIEITGVQVE